LHSALEILLKRRRYYSGLETQGDNMFLQNLIKKQLTKFNFEDIAKQLGYSSSKNINNRITALIESSNLNLDQSHYDFHYSTPQLVRKLCQILAIPSEICDVIINEIEESLRADQRRFKPYIFIETNFKRSTQPVFMLASLQSERYLEISEDIQRQPLNEQLQQVQHLIKFHYQQQSVIRLWGIITQYAYFYDENTVVVLSTSGEVMAIKHEYFISKATMSI